MEVSTGDIILDMTTGHHFMVIEYDPFWNWSQVVCLETGSSMIHTFDIPATKFTKVA